MLNAQFVDQNYAKKPGVLPVGRIKFDKSSLTDCQLVIKNYLEKNWRQIVREKNGVLPYPYVVPGGTYNNLWDWDGYFIASGIPKAGLRYAAGTIMNLLAAPTKNGQPVKMTSPDGQLSYAAHPYPLRAQFACLIARRQNGDYSFIKPFLPQLESAIRWYEQNTCDKDGFFRWQTQSGIDNHPALYGRPSGQTAGCDLASFHYREYLAFAQIKRHFNLPGADEADAKADKLRHLVQTCYFDPVDQFFYDIDRAESQIQSRQIVNWVTYLKFRNCGSFFPLWAQLATPQQAEAMRNRLMDETEFLSPWGLRSQSRIDPVYNNALSGNPSNWQGPVWILPNALAAYGLNAYGFKADAMNIAMRIVNLLAHDIEQNGCMHEYYDGETGQPVIKPHFISWNILASDLIDNLQKNYNPFDISEK